VKVADGALDRLEYLHLIEDAMRSGGDHIGALGWPAFTRIDKAQARQPEIRHRARDRANVVGKLRLDQDHARSRRSTQCFVLSVPAPGILRTLEQPAV
jgi:hypothetical protein